MTQITLSDDFEAYVKNLIESGEYASVNEVIRDALRLHADQKRVNAEKLEALRADIAAGIASLDAGRYCTQSVTEIIAEIESAERSR